MNNVSFTGYAYPQGKSPRDILEPHTRGFGKQQEAKVKNALIANAGLVKANSDSKLDISFTDDHAYIKLVSQYPNPPQIKDKINHLKSLEIMSRWPLETINHFVKRVLQYVLDNRQTLEKVDKDNELDFYKQLAES